MILICGEALVDLIPDPLEPARYDAMPGGGPANTAVAVARLGSPASMLVRLSSDGFGGLLRAHLVGNGVNLSGAVDALEQSSVALTTVSHDGVAEYRFMVAGTADWGWTDAELADPTVGVVAVHSGSLALALPPGGAAVERWLARARQSCTVSLDPNIRPALIPDLLSHRETIERCVRIADIVKLSREDLDALLPGEPAMDVAARWVRSGPALVVITDGAAGSVGVTAHHRVSCPAVSVAVVDTIGAGDTFTAAVLDWLYRAGRLGGRLAELGPDGIAAMLQYASRAAAATCSRRGADSPYGPDLLPPSVP